MARPKRSDQINLEEAIQETAWAQIAERGAAALSLRAIARQLNITAPAIYNYYTRRDDLVTALIIDAYTSLGDSQYAALGALPVSDHAQRLRTIAEAYREWALTYPQRYQLIFGTPIPGYHAPLECTTPAAARSLEALISVLEGARLSGNLQQRSSPTFSAGLQKQIKSWREENGEIRIDILYLAMAFWSRVHGMASLEINNQYPTIIEDPGEIFQHEVDSIIKEYLT